jgi:hypothetical protein
MTGSTSTGGWSCTHPRRSVTRTSSRSSARCCAATSTRAAQALAGEAPAVSRGPDRRDLAREPVRADGARRDAGRRGARLALAHRRAPGVERAPRLLRRRGVAVARGVAVDGRVPAGNPRLALNKTELRRVSDRGSNPERNSAKGLLGCYCRSRCSSSSRRELAVHQLGRPRSGVNTSSRAASSGVIHGSNTTPQRAGDHQQVAVRMHSFFESNAPGCPTWRPA